MDVNVVVVAQDASGEENSRYDAHQSDGPASILFEASLYPILISILVLVH